MVSGFISQDVLQIGNIKVSNAIFMEATSEDGPTFSASPFDGIMGLGLIKASINGIKPVYVHLFDENIIDDMSFSFYLTKNSKEIGSHLILGGFSEEYESSDFTYHPLVGDFYWYYNLNEINIKYYLGL